MTAARDPYDVLGVPRTASTPQIRAAYIAHARRAHPDLNGGRGVDVMRALNEAWEILKDAARRKAWDAANYEPSNGASPMEDEHGRPFWTGAMGPPPGRPIGPVLDFGIYERWSIGEIARVDRGYLIWLRDRPEAAAIQADIVRILDPAAEEPEPARARSRWSRRR